MVIAETIIRFFTSPDNTAMWNNFGNIAKVIAAIVTVAALIYSIAALRKTLQTSHYAELDTMYFNLLKSALDKPYLNNPKTLDTDKQKSEYEIYAFMVWNFLETIYDRCGPSKRLIRIRELRDTWYPVIVTENHLQREWFDNPDNKLKFKDEFHEFIRSDGFKQQ